MERTYTITKDPSLGFGFVVGNDFPTIVKLVNPDGPSFDRLKPRDIILAVNGVSVEKLSKEQIVKMFDASNGIVEVKVRQMHEEMIKFFSEIDVKTMLKYDVEATVGELLEKLNQKFFGESPHFSLIKKFFGIVLTSEKNTEGKTTARKLYTLDENDSITKLKQLEYASSLRLIYRMINPPTNIEELFFREKLAFDYLYRQSCNDLKIGRFRPELDEASSCKLSALHLLEYVYTHHSRNHNNSRKAEVYLDLFKENFGLKDFASRSVVDKLIKNNKVSSSAYKKLRNKLEETLTTILADFNPNESSNFTLSDRIKLMFLNYLSKLPCYGNSEHPPDRTTPSSLSSSLDQTSDSLSLIRPDDSATSNYNDRFLEERLNNRIEVEERYHNQPYDNHSMNLKHINDMSNSNNQLNNGHDTSINKQLFQRRASERYHKDRVDGRPLNNNLKFHTRSNERLNHQTNVFNPKSIDEALKNFFLPPPPPPTFAHDVLLRVLTDKDIEKLRVPRPPPPLLY